MEDKLIGKIFESKHCGDFTIIELIEVNNRMKRYLVRFNDTNFETIAYYTNIKKGAVLDKTLDKPICKYKVGQIIESGSGKKAEIIEINKQPRKNDDSKNRTVITVKMVDTGYVTTCLSDNFIRDKVKDYLTPTVKGVGMLGYVESLEEQGNLRDMKEYRLWEGILYRCYSSNHDIENKSYRNVKVCDRWLRFDYFYEDIQKVEGYNSWKEYHEKYPNKKNIYEFDKDTKVLGNKIYSLETCQFIPKKINAGFTSWATLTTKKKILDRLEEIKREGYRDERYINEKCFRVRTIYYNGQSNSKLIRRFKKHSPKNNMVNAFRWFKL
jgi:hypothetical protein